MACSIRPPVLRARLLLPNFRARRLDLTAAYLGIEAAALRASGRTRRFANARRLRGLVDQHLQSGECIVAVLIEASVALRLDDDHALRRDAPIVAGQQPLLDCVGKR